MNYYIADTHFYHKNIIDFDSRPFFDLEDMHTTMIENWNNAVNNGDIVYILGDFNWGLEPEWFKVLDSLKGQKWLIFGNHDLKHMSRKLKERFLGMSDYKEIADSVLTLSGTTNITVTKKVVMSHYPMLLYAGAYSPDKYMLCGHIHNTRENDFLVKWRKELKESRKNSGDSCGNIINVGCMMPYMDYTPRSLEYLITHGLN